MRYCETFRIAFIGFNSRRLHHLEDDKMSPGASPLAMFVSVNKTKGVFEGDG
jgi:hypothetical protein